MIKIELENILKKKDISLYKVSKDTGIGYATLHNLLKQKTKGLTFETLEKICIVLECTPNDLLVLEK